VVATTFLLVRHAAHDWLGRGIPGRLPCVALNRAGREEAQALAASLADARIDVLYSSPQQRAQETVAPLAARLRRPVAVAPEFDEIDFGEWTGRTMAQLEADTDRWRVWVEQRSVAAPPGGEPFARVQQRARAGLERLARRHAGKIVLVMSHGDVIKALLASCLGLSLDHMERFEIAPASLSVLAAIGEGYRVTLVNQSLAAPWLPP
jgi:broad specificity phosphatase PhoE